MYSYVTVGTTLPVTEAFLSVILGIPLRFKVPGMIEITTRGFLCEHRIQRKLIAWSHGRRQRD